jgi:hypothetical protein
MQSRNDIGFGKKIRACWLESAVEQAARGITFDQAKEPIAKEISADNAGAEAIRKILTGLKRVWFTPPDYCRALRDAGLDLFRHDNSPATRLILSWGMAVAAYPFVGDVAEALGRLLKLQREAHRADIERRVREQHGDRGFVSRIARYNVSSFLDWGVIVPAKKGGVYLPGKQVHPRNADQLAWLAEAVLISRGEHQMPFPQLCHHPVLFPVKLDTFNASVLRANPRLRVERQSLNEEFVSLAQHTTINTKH